jgi:5'-nucleotidase
VLLELTGRQLERVLNQQWTDQPNLRIMRCSGLVYTWDPNAPGARRVTLADMALADGTPIEADRLYSVTVNNFLADGGHNLTVLKESGTRVPGPTDIEALVAYVEQLPQPFTSRVEGRIRMRT